MVRNEADAVAKRIVVLKRNLTDLGEMQRVHFEDMDLLNRLSARGWMVMAGRARKDRMETRGGRRRSRLNLREGAVFVITREMIDMVQQWKGDRRRGDFGLGGDALAACEW